MEVGESVSHAWDKLGPIVARQFAESFVAKYGAIDPRSIAAMTALKQLENPIVSPSAISAAIFANAPVSIPNSRSSGEPRKKGRSVD